MCHCKKTFLSKHFLSSPRNHLVPCHPSSHSGTASLLHPVTILSRYFLLPASSPPPIPPCTTNSSLSPTGCLHFAPHPLFIPSVQLHKHVHIMKTRRGLHECRLHCLSLSLSVSNCCWQLAHNQPRRVETCQCPTESVGHGQAESLKEVQDDGEIRSPTRTLPNGFGAATLQHTCTKLEEAGIPSTLTRSPPWSGALRDRGSPPKTPALHSTAVGCGLNGVR